MGKHEMNPLGICSESTTMFDISYRGLSVPDGDLAQHDEAAPPANLLYRGLHVQGPAAEEEKPDGRTGGPSGVAPSTDPGPASLLDGSNGAERAAMLRSVRRRFVLRGSWLWRTAAWEALTRLPPEGRGPIAAVSAVQVAAGAAILLTVAILGIGLLMPWMPYLIGLDVGLVLGALALRFAAALAKAQSDALASLLDRVRQDIPAHRVRNYGEGQPVFRTLPLSAGSNAVVEPDRYRLETTLSLCLRRGDVVLVERGSLVPCDGEILEGAALLDEAAITGESTAVLREAGGDDAPVRAGVRVVSGCILVRAAGPGWSDGESPPLP